MPRRFSFKGWIGDWFFRSLKEVSFYISCKENGLTCRTAETEEFAVWYTDIYGRRRKHYPDFFVNEHIVVEVKPRSHQKGKTVQLKAKAMKEFCDSKGYLYQMVSPRKVSKEALEKLIKNKEIIFTDDCKDKIEQYLKRRK